MATSATLARIVLLMALAITETTAVATYAANGPWSCTIRSDTEFDSEYTVVCEDRCVSGASVCEHALSDAIDACFEEMTDASIFDGVYLGIQFYTEGTPSFCDLLEGSLGSSYVDESAIRIMRIQSNSASVDDSLDQDTCNKRLAKLLVLQLLGVGGLSEIAQVRKAVGLLGMDNLLVLDIERAEGLELDLEYLVSLSTNLASLRIVDIDLAEASPDLSSLTSLADLTVRVPESSTLQITSLGLANMTSLEVIQLEGDGLRGSIVTLASALPESITALSIKGKTNLDDADDAGDGALLLENVVNSLLAAPNATQNLQFLQLSNCVLSGSVPESLVELPGLLALDVSQNDLQGPVPEVISTQLFMANFSANRISGSYTFPISSISLAVDISNNLVTDMVLADALIPDTDALYASEGGESGDDSNTTIGLLGGLWDLWTDAVVAGQRFDFTGNNMTCTCSLMNAAWEVLNAQHGSDDIDSSWICRNTRATSPTVLELPVVEIAGSPCDETGAFATIDSIDFGASDITLDWSVSEDAINSLNVPSSRSSSAKAKWNDDFASCSGCSDLLAYVESTGSSPWNEDEFGFMVLVETAEYFGDCCFAVRMRSGKTNYSSVVPLDSASAINEATFSVTAFSILTPVDSSIVKVYDDIAAQSVQGFRPSGVTLETDSDSSLILSFPDLVSANRRRTLLENTGTATALDNAYWELVDMYTGEALYHEALPSSGSVDLKYYLLKGSNAAVYEARIAENRSGVVREIYSSNIGAYLSLRACPAGLGVVQAVNETTGRSQCEVCPRDTYSTAQLLVCALCPTGTMSPTEGAVNSSDCNIAMPSYIQDCIERNATDCTGPVDVSPCSSVMNCSLPGTTRGNMELLDGYWRASRKSVNVYVCPNEFCTPSHEDDRQFCAAKHEGFLCSRCKQGYGFEQVKGKEVCLTCTESRKRQQLAVLCIVAVIFAILGALPLAYVASRYCKSNASRGHAARSESDVDGEGNQQTSRIRPRSSYHSLMKRMQSSWKILWHCGAVKARIALGFFHIYLCVAIFFPVDDMPMTSHLRLGNTINASCLVEATYYVWMVFHSAPAMLWVSGIVVAGLIARRLLPAPDFVDMRDKLYSWFFFTLFGAVPFALWSSLATFMCADVEGVLILRISYSTYCEGSAYEGWRVYSCLVLIFFVFGGLLAFLIPLRSNIALLRKGNWGPAEREKVRWLDFLHSPYTNRASWFEGFDFGRKLVLIAGVVALRPGPTAVMDDDGSSSENAYDQGFVQIAYALVCTILSVFLFQFIQPYRNRFDAAFASLSQANLISIYIGAMLWTSSNSSDSEKRRYGGALWAIIAFELASLVGFALYDAVHLSQYPDREDEMRVKLRRNFYHRTAPLASPTTPGSYADADLEAQCTPGGRTSWRHDTYSSDSPRAAGFVPSQYAHDLNSHASAVSKTSYTMTPEQTNSFLYDTPRADSSDSSDKGDGNDDDRGALRARSRNGQYDALPSPSQNGRLGNGERLGRQGLFSPQDADGDAYTSDGIPSPRRMAIDVTAGCGDEAIEAADKDAAIQLRSSKDFMVLDGIHFSTEAYVVLPPPSSEGEHEFDLDNSDLVPVDVPTKGNLVRLGVLGTGVSGTVYICLDKRNLHLVAVKEIALLNASLATREVRALDLVRKYAETHKDDVASDRVVQMHNAFLDQDAQRIGVVMAFESGGSLQDVLDDLQEARPLHGDSDEVAFKLRTVLSSSVAQRAVSALEKTLSAQSMGSEHSDQGDTGAVDIYGICNEVLLAQVAKDILSALAVLDELGLLHLDVKPANVLVSREGRATLADFGLCQSLSSYERKESTKVAGTLKYMSPERLRGERASHASDIWAFGITLLSLVHGRYPVALGDENTSSDQEKAVGSTARSASMNQGGGGGGDSHDLYWKLLERVGGATVTLPAYARVCSSAGSSFTTVARVRFSAGFRDFMSKTLAVNPANRPSANVLLQHPWLKVVDESALPSPPSTFDSSCQLLERASNALVESLPLRAKVAYSDAHVRCLGEKLGLSPEIVKYSLAVASSERDDVSVNFKTDTCDGTTREGGNGVRDVTIAKV
ncbi:Protein kinase, putative [Hondaea fermentalgiana]|uniref:Protein kinase, putative n=1 Tax=Hondaea fermentalgiana TaxID=2315210 RepID=A0A2R5GP93_9STRA|nr:Protein kinase, putative [Hondaea fermentalgiana]|eukprot:GBG30141.1 Protein kinase, putative [Hondaea fermentalgiana]